MYSVHAEVQIVCSSMNSSNHQLKIYSVYQMFVERQFLNYTTDDDYFADNMDMLYTVVINM